MADLKLSINIGILASVIIGEIFSTLWYHDHSPWWHGHRYWVAALVCDVGLAFVLQYITHNYWSVSYRDIEALAILSACLTLVLVCLEAPHYVHNGRSLRDYTFHALHKFLLMFIMMAVMDYCKKFG